MLRRLLSGVTGLLGKATGGLASAVGGGLFPWLAGGAGVLVLAVGGYIASLHWQAHGLRTDLARAEAATAKAQAATADAKAGIAVCEAAADSLADTVARQNERIRQIQSRRREAEALAALNSVRVLARERQRELPDGHGPQAMNAWLQDVIGPSGPVHE